MSLCCSIKSPGVVAPPDCNEVAAAGDRTLCGLSLIAIQSDFASTSLVTADPNFECGTPPAGLGDPYHAPTDPGCIALDSCGSALMTAQKAMSVVVSAFNRAGPCQTALGYLESEGLCADAGSRRRHVVWSPSGDA